jgi:hypothetical protein
MFRQHSASRDRVTSASARQCFGFQVSRIVGFVWLIRVGRHRRIVSFGHWPFLTLFQDLRDLRAIDATSLAIFSCVHPASASSTIRVFRSDR